MKSRLADQARQDQNNAVRDMTPEQRLRAYQQHNRLIFELYAAGRRAASGPAGPGSRDAGK